MGNLWVWPGTHLTHEAWFAREGPRALVIHGGYPPIAVPTPEQIMGRSGDVLLAHYLLGHNIGGNTSDRTRYATYYRMRRPGHDQRWTECLRAAWMEYDGVRQALELHQIE